MFNNFTWKYHQFYSHTALCSWLSCPVREAKRVQDMEAPVVYQEILMGTFKNCHLLCLLLVTRLSLVMLSVLATHFGLLDRGRRPPVRKETHQSLPQLHITSGLSPQLTEKEMLFFFGIHMHKNTCTCAATHTRVCTLTCANKHRHTNKKNRIKSRSTMWPLHTIEDTK